MVSLKANTKNIIFLNSEKIIKGKKITLENIHLSQKKQ